MFSSPLLTKFLISALITIHHGTLRYTNVIDTTQKVRGHGPNECNIMVRCYRYCVNCLVRTHTMYECDSSESFMYCGRLHQNSHLRIHVPSVSDNERPSERTRSRESCRSTDRVIAIRSACKTLATRGRFHIENCQKKNVKNLSGKIKSNCRFTYFAAAKR